MTERIRSVYLFGNLNSMFGIPSSSADPAETCQRNIGATPTESSDCRRLSVGIGVTRALTVRWNLATPNERLSTSSAAACPPLENRRVGRRLGDIRCFAHCVAAPVAMRHKPTPGPGACGPATVACCLAFAIQPESVPELPSSGALLRGSRVLQILPALKSLSLAFALAGAEKLRVLRRKDVLLKKAKSVRR